MKSSYLKTLEVFPNVKTLVIGEGMLDVYVNGNTDKICKEAPVPVVSVKDITVAPGGAANTATNVKALGAHTTFLSVIGNDHEGKSLLHSLSQRSINTKYVIQDNSRKTLTKKRIISSSQLLVRVDSGSIDDIRNQTENKFIANVARLYPTVDVVIVTDHDYGILTSRVISKLKELQEKYNKVLYIDSKSIERFSLIKATAMKQSYKEALHLLGISQETSINDRVEQIKKYRDQLLQKTGSHIVAITLDSDGTLVFEGDKKMYRTTTKPAKNSRAAGAGDTFVSAFALALGTGSSPFVAAELAAKAAQIVVNKDGTSSCSLMELKDAILGNGKHIRTRKELHLRMNEYRKEGRKIVFTNGCFDILHMGHVSYLQKAKELGDILIVGVNSDDSVKRLKGPERPINTSEDRQNILTALSSVDHVIEFREDTPINLINIVQPDIYVKGGDYTRETLPETVVVERYGGKVEIIPFVMDRSTSSIVKKIRSQQEQAPQQKKEAMYISVQ